MNKKSKGSGLVNKWFDSGGKEGREKQKIRIKYRQRVKIKKRPKGYKLTRYWKRYRKNLLAYIVLIILLGATMFMIVQVAQQQLEMNQHKTRQRL
jgi:site-specific recombinase